MKVLERSASAVPDAALLGAVPSSGVFSAEHRALTLGIIISASTIAFESLAVATVLPAAAFELDGLGSYGWAFSAFLLTSLIGAIAAGDQADTRGPGLPARIGFGLFGAGLLCAGLAPAWPVFLFGRALQGLGGGALLALAYLAVARGYPDAQRARILALLSSAWLIPALVGPAIAGQVAELVSWRAVFLGLLPLVLIGAGLFGSALTHLPGAGTATDASRRLSASVRLAIGVGLLLWALGQAEVSLSVVVSVVVGVVLAGPALGTLLPRGTLAARPGLPAGTLLRVLLLFGFSGAEALIPLGLATIRQLPPSEVGFALSAAALTWVGAAWVQERADTRDGGRGRPQRLRFGLGLSILGILGAGAAVLWSASPVVLTAVAWSIGGLGLGLAYPASTALALSASETGREGEASAALQIAETLGTAIGAGTSGALFAVSLRLNWSMSDGIVLAFVVAAAVVVIAFIPAARSRALSSVSRNGRSLGWSARSASGGARDVDA